MAKQTPSTRLFLYRLTCPKRPDTSPNTFAGTEEQELEIAPDSFGLYLQLLTSTLGNSTWRVACAGASFDALAPRAPVIG